MAQQIRVLCACLGNNDRSPYMKGFLEQMLENQGRNNVTVDSAGVFESAKRSGGAPEFSVKLAPTYGIDLSDHRKKHVEKCELSDYDLIVAADLQVMQALYLEHGVKKTEIICLDLEGADNAWLSRDPRKIEAMIVSIMYKIAVCVIQYKFRVEN